MADSDQIMFGTRRSADQLADQIAQALDLYRGTSPSGSDYVNRSSSTDHEHTLNANFRVNVAEEGILPGEESVKDGYAVYVDIYLVPTSDEERQVESRRLFDDLVAVVDVPMIYLRNYDHLEAAFQPGIGVSDLGAGISPYADAAPEWHPFIVDRDSAPS